jgi:hypothetical protein
MPLSKRTATCDICGFVETEQLYGTGFPNWAIIQGIGAQAPVEGQPLDNVNLETYCCPSCTRVLTRFITGLQGE